jgi:putative endonuclease
MRRIGSDAEDRAAEFLIGKGFTIVTRRYRAPHGELDLVALDGDDLVFVEVKERRSGISPESFIGSQKISRLHSAARDYLLRTNMADREYRFDVVSIEGSEIRHHAHAFLDRYEPAQEEFDVPNEID